MLFWEILCFLWLFHSWQPTRRKKTMHSCSASSGKPDSNSLDCIVFSCFVVYRDWNRWSDEGFTFLVSDISISWGYLLMQISLWQPLYLHSLDIHCYRCFFWDRCIRAGLIFAVADALFGINVSAACFSSNLQILLSLPVMYNCIYILPFLWPEDASRRNFASSTGPFYTLQIPPTEFLHPHFQKIHYHKYLPYSLNSMTWADTLLTKKLI